MNHGVLYKSPQQLEYARAKYEECDQDIEAATSLSRSWKLIVLRKYMPFCIAESQFTDIQWRDMSYSEMLNARNEGMEEAMKDVRRGILPKYLCTTDLRREYWLRMLVKHKGHEAMQRLCQCFPGE